MNHHQNHSHFEMSTSGNVLAEILREVDKAHAELAAGNVSGATIFLESCETIMEDVCNQYGARVVFGCHEISKLANA